MYVYLLEDGELMYCSADFMYRLKETDAEDSKMGGGSIPFGKEILCSVNPKSDLEGQGLVSSEAAQDRPARIAFFSPTAPDRGRHAV